MYFSKKDTLRRRHWSPTIFYFQPLPQEMIPNLTVVVVCACFSFMWVSKKTPNPPTGI